MDHPFSRPYYITPRPHLLVAVQVRLTEQLPGAKELDASSPDAAAVLATPVACAALVRAAERPFGFKSRGFRRR
jgi:hypothetical protein